MSGQKGVLAIIPAKGTSERLPRKNLRLLGGRPMITYTIDAALESALFDEICVTTDDDQVAQIAKDRGVSVPFSRPEVLATSEARLVDVCIHTIEFYRSQGLWFPTFALLLATSPMRTAQDIKDCYSHFNSTGADVVMSYSEFDHSPYWALVEEYGRLRPISPEAVHKGRNELALPYRYNGAVLFMRTDVFIERGEYYVDDIAGWYLPSPNGMDVDTEYDLLHAEFLLGHNPRVSNP